MNLENFNSNTTNYLYDISKNTTNEVFYNDIDDNDIIKFSKNDINHLFDNLNEEHQNILFGKLLVSEKYYYLVINNYYILNKMKSVIYKLILIYRYLLSYTWIYLYYNELKKGRDTKVTDNFIFDINTASLLPIFPFDHTRPKSNPYMPILVNNIDLKPFDNFCGVPEYFDSEVNNAGICNLDEFRIRLNLFCTGEIYFNIFENVDFQKYKIAITGSVMAACLQRKHPLMSILKYNGRTESCVFCSKGKDNVFRTFDSVDRSRSDCKTEIKDSNSTTCDGNKIDDSILVDCKLEKFANIFTNYLSQIRHEIIINCFLSSYKK
jgi:hypothetical protein